MHKNKAFIAPLGLVSITILSGVFLMSSNSSATDTTDAVDSVSIGVPISCSIEGTGMNSHTASVPNGTYQADIGTTTIKAFCNDDEGFAIFAVGYTGDEIGGANSTKLVGTNGSIVTGTATSGDTSNWAMKLATDSGATYAITLDNSFGSYSAVPASYTKVAHRDSGTDIGAGATGSSLTTTYAAYISKTESADIYNGKVKYTLVHPATEEPLQPQPATAGCINYFANASTAVGEMGCQSASNYSSRTLWASNFKRDGYGFAGWNDAFDYSGNYYGPNQTIATPVDVSTNGLSLYAVWIKSAGSLQNWNGCSSLASGATTALTDERDNNTYAVAKLADGKCWMIENLRLADKDSSNNDIELSSTNTHNPSLPITNIYNADSSQATTSNHLSATTDPTTTAWCTFAFECVDQSMLATNNTTLFTSNTASGYSASSNVYSYGNYYNWYSATAGHGTYSKSSGNTAGDICPAGWHLPTGDTSGEYNSLNTALSGTDTGTTASNNLRSYPNNFVYSGTVLGSSVSFRNSEGHYWSSSAYGTDYAYCFQLFSSSVRQGANGSGKYRGRMARCVAGV